MHCQTDLGHGDTRVGGFQTLQGDVDIRAVILPFGPHRHGRIHGTGKRDTEQGGDTRKPVTRRCQIGAIARCGQVSGRCALQLQSGEGDGKRPHVGLLERIAHGEPQIDIQRFLAPLAVKAQTARRIGRQITEIIGQHRRSQPDVITADGGQLQPPLRSRGISRARNLAAQTDRPFDQDAFRQQATRHRCHVQRVVTLQRTGGIQTRIDGQGRSGSSGDREIEHRRTRRERPCAGCQLHTLPDG